MMNIYKFNHFFGVRNLLLVVLIVFLTINIQTTLSEIDGMLLNYSKELTLI